jgi:branched-chain amino acid transport system permease protein
VILTFAVGQVIISTIRQWTPVTGGVNGIAVPMGRRTLLWLRVSDTIEFYALCVICLIAVLFALLAIRRSRWGLTLQSVRENPTLARSLGVNVARRRVEASAVLGAIAGVAGSLYLSEFRAIDPTQFGTSMSVYFLLAVLLGGRKYLLGPVIGAFVYIFLPEAFTFSPARSQIAFGVVLIATILLLPDGLLSVVARVRGLRRSTGARPNAGDAGGENPGSSKRAEFSMHIGSRG